jgi:hypothetical protein
VAALGNAVRHASARLGKRETDESKRQNERSTA